MTRRAVVALQGIARDISDRVAVEEKLRSNEKFLQTVIDTEPECVKMLAADGTLLMMNPSGLAMIDALFPSGHPYHWATIGSPDDLRAATADDVRAFFRRYYHPANASMRPLIWSSPVARALPFDNATNGFTSSETQAAIEEARSTAVANDRFPFIFSWGGSAENKWLDTVSGISSFATPLYVFENFVITVVSVAYEKIPRHSPRLYVAF